MSAIAVIGLATRVPGARDAAALWANLYAGRETLTRFTAEELLAAGVEPALAADPRYVPVAGVIEDVTGFDAEFFGFSPREAQLLDPQHRHFLEVAWSALEDAGYDPAATTVPVGVFAGARINTYLLENLLPNRHSLADLGLIGAIVGNDKDFLATGVSYRLGLTGPSMTVQTACSTSLVATHLACQSLLAGECDLALAGGSAIAVPHHAGYLYQEGAIYSRDGHCRAFSAEAGGTVGGSGVGAVVLRRLADAIAAGDPIRAVILASAVNNDGRRKVGFTAPSVDGQTRVIAEALAVAGVGAGTVGYVEAHGTGTPLGDPIEVAALTAAFRADTDATGYCGLGSIKTNMGHLDAAAGVTGLIKATLAVQHGTIPPSLHFTTANRALRLDESPFFVPTAPSAWRVPGPRRAGVSSFGIGGTNAHVVLEEAPEVAAAPVPDGPELIVVSARTAAALHEARERLAGALDGVPVADAGATLREGRTAMRHRVAVVTDGRDPAADLLAAPAPAPAADAPRVVFLFPGQGAQRPGAGSGLYATEPAYRSVIDHAAELLRPELGLDLRDLLHADPRDTAAARTLTRTRFAQPALFTVGVALAELWRHWGVTPDAMAGHSLGEYVAATVAGVFELDDALRIVARRGELMDVQPTGSMLAVLDGPDAVADLVDDEVVLAALNAPRICVLSGPAPRIAEAGRQLSGRGIATRPVTTSHAFHSPMMAPVADELHRELARLTLRVPAIAYSSCLTGTLVTAAEATSPRYWAAQLREPVRFADALDAATAGAAAGVFVELGPGRTLSGLAALAYPSGWTAIPALGDSGDRAAALTALGSAWSAGVPVDWPALRQGRAMRRVSLPAYPFARDRHWIDPPRTSGPAPATATATAATAADAATAAAAAEPRPVPDEIAAIWRELLGVTVIRPDDDFYALGGHSLLGAQLLARLRDRLGVEVSLGDLLTASTVADQVRLVTSSGTANAGGPTPVPRDPAGMPLSRPQQRLWALEQLDPGTAVYHLPFALDLAGPLDLAALQRALTAVVGRHEALRSRFVTVDGLPRQIAAKAEPVTLTIEPPGDLMAEICRPFDLAAGPPVRFALWRTGADRHRLIVTAHHLVLDGWSVGVLVRELAHAYTGGDLGPPPLHCADVAAWQRTRESDADVAAWRAALDGFTDSRADLTPVTRPAMPSGRGGRVTTYLDADVRSLLETGGGLFPSLLAGLGAVLADRSDADRFVIGTPVANRPHPSLEDVVGLVANTVPLPIDTGGDPSLGELRDRASVTVRQALTLQHVPFEQIAAACAPAQRDPGRNPLFDVLLVLQNAPMPPLRLGDLSVTPADVHTGTAKFDLTVDATPDGDRLRLTAEYSADLWDEPSARALLHRYAEVLTVLAEAPQTPLHEPPPSVVLDGGPAYPAALVTDLLSDVDGTAVVDASETMTYADLSAAADQVARHLYVSGVRRGDRVAVCLPRTARSVAALIGVVRAGAAYVPLDPSYPAARLAQMLTTSHARFVLTDGGHDLPLEGRTVIGLPDAPVPAQPIEPPGLDDLVYIVFTSGSTGTPKGIGLSHRALGNVVQWQVQRSELPLRTAQLTPFGFDVHFQEIFGTLAAGATLVVAPDELRQDPQALLGWLAEHGIERLFLPYVALAGIADAARRTGTLPGSLREVATAGERLQVTDAVRDLFRRLPGCRLDNHYGPAETHVVTAYRLAGDPGDWPVLPPIGRPLPGVRCEIVAGELHLSGVQLADGYIGNPAETAQRFTGGGYRTGDLVRLLPGGELAYEGRADDQVKIRGFRVEPAEVEAVLGGHPGVRECAVVAEPGPDGRLRLVGYAVGDAAEADLRQWLAERVPGHLVPARMRTVERLPRTPSGKVDRRRLAALAEPPQPPQAPPVATDPRTGPIADVIAELLQVPAGADDDFFVLGGDSILAIALAARLGDAGLVVAPRDIFAYPTAAALAAHLGTDRPRSTFPATARQRALLNTTARIADIRCPHRLDPAALAATADALARRHPALRARITDEVEILPQPDGPLLVEADLARLTPDRADQAIGRISADLAASLDPAHGDVFRIAVCHGPDHDTLLVAAHPAAIDDPSCHRLLAALHQPLMTSSAGPAGDGASTVLTDLPESRSSWLRWLADPGPRRPGTAPHRTHRAELRAAELLRAGTDVVLRRDEHPAAPEDDRVLGQWEVDVFVSATPPPADVAEAIRRVKQANATPPAGAEAVVVAATSTPTGTATVDPAAVLVPQDFPLAPLTTDELRELLARHGVPDDVYAVTPMQHTMLVRAAEQPRPGLYAVRTTDALPAFIDPHALREAFSGLIARHPIMRTSFPEASSGHLQWVHADADLPWTDLDWRHLPPAGLRARYETLLADDFATPFDLTRPSLARCTLIRLRRGYQLVFTAHHLLLDGWSRSLLLADLPALYAQALARRPWTTRSRTLARQVPLLWRIGPAGIRSLLAAQRAGMPPAPTPPAAHIQAMSTQDRDAARRHWDRYLHGAPDPVLPPARHRDPAGGYRRRARTVDPATVHALADLTRRHGVTAATAAQLAWALLLTRRTGTDEAVFGVTSSGRRSEVPGYDRMVGLFITTLPLRIAVPADRTVAEALRAVQDDLVAARAHEHLPLAEIERGAGRTLCRSVVVVDNFPQDTAQHRLAELLRAGHPFGTDHDDLGMTEFPLRLEVIPVNGLHVALCHHRDEYGDADADDLLGEWTRLLGEIAANPERRIGDLRAATVTTAGDRS